MCTLYNNALCSETGAKAIKNAFVAFTIELSVNLWRRTIVPYFTVQRYTWEERRGFRGKTEM